MSIYACFCESDHDTLPPSQWCDACKGKELTKKMEFDHVVRIHEDGTVTDEQGVYAPNLYENELDDGDWQFFTTGYSGQGITREWMRTNPIMHNSESIGGRLEKDLLATPGVYAAIVASWNPDENGETVFEGWAIVRLRES